MAKTYTEAVHNGTQAAGTLARTLGLRAKLDEQLGSVDIFEIIAQLELPLLMRPIKGLLGAFLNAPTPGILVTTERPLSIQRFTAAHELGHWLLKHKPSLDDEDQILRRGPLTNEASTAYQETEADAFAIALLMPKWLILAHCSRQGWRSSDLKRPQIAYQLSLRLGVSYEATCRTLERYRLIDSDTRETMSETSPRSLKINLLGKFKPESYRGDVWHITEKDNHLKISGSSNDLIVIEAEELGGAGYLWSPGALLDAGFEIYEDVSIELDTDGIGGNNVRRLLAKPNVDLAARISIVQNRPWAEDDIAGSLEFSFDFTGPETAGLTRAERRQILGEA